MGVACCCCCWWCWEGDTWHWTGLLQCGVAEKATQCCSDDRRAGAPPHDIERTDCILIEQPARAVRPMDTCRETDQWNSDLNQSATEADSDTLSQHNNVMSQGRTISWLCLLWQGCWDGHSDQVTWSPAVGTGHNCIASCPVQSATATCNSSATASCHSSAVI